MKSISVIIPNYNGVNLLKENIPHVINALETSQIKDYELIIPDDASSDDSINFINTNYPNVILVANKVNQGFSGNVNSGLAKASKDLVFILNSDVKVLEHYFTPLLPYFEKEDTFGVMGRIISMDGDQLQDAAKFPQYHFGKINATVNYLIPNQSSCYSFFLSGANSLIDRKKMLLLGGYNELFNPYYSEDADLGIRAWRAGYKLYYEDTAVCKHPNSVTINQQKRSKVKTIAKRNQMLLHYLHLDGFELYYCLTLYFMKSFFRLLIGDRIYWDAWRQFTFNFSKIASYKRKQTNLNYNLNQVCSSILADLQNKEVKKF